MTDNARPADLTKHNAAAFQLEDVVARYHFRTPYPSTLAPFLRDLAGPRGGPVLELGCGTGEVTRALAPLVERIDAIDISRAMLARARSLPGGNHPAIRWIEAAAEDAPLDGPYALAVAGDALHWFDWDVTLPRIAAALRPGAVLAVVHAVIPRMPWSDDVAALFRRYSVIQNPNSVDLIEELESRDLLRVTGRTTLGPEPYPRTLDDYIQAMHATASLPRSRMGETRARAFDAEVRALVASHAPAGVLTLDASAEIVWGRPCPSSDLPVD